ncbi:MAG: hypothetical protein WBG92_01720 [Thiohalocapsa sp.]
MQAEVVADLVHAVAATRVGGGDRFVPPCVRTRTIRKRPCLSLGDLAEVSANRKLPAHRLDDSVGAEQHVLLEPLPWQG